MRSRVLYRSFLGYWILVELLPCIIVHDEAIGQWLSGWAGLRVCAPRYAGRSVDGV